MRADVLLWIAPTTRIIPLLYQLFPAVIRVFFVIIGNLTYCLAIWAVKLPGAVVQHVCNLFQLPYIAVCLFF